MYNRVGNLSKLMCLEQLLFFFKIFIEMLINNVVLVSGVQQSDSVIHIHLYLFFFRFFSIIGCYKILSIVPCAIQQVLIGYLFYIQQCVYFNPKLLVYPSSPSPFGNHKFVFYVCESASFLLHSLACCIFQIPRISDIILYLSFSV